MARNRMIKKEFWTSEQIMNLNYASRLLFIGMWNQADDVGVLKYSPLQLKAQIFPCDSVTTEDIEHYVKCLYEQELIVFNSDLSLIKIKRWEHHQKINKPTPTKYEFVEDNHVALNERSGSNHEVVIDRSGAKERNIKEYKGKEINRSETSDKVSITIESEPTMKPTSYQDKVEKWYNSFINDEDKLKEFKDTFPDLDIKQKLGECKGWLMDNVRKNKDRTFFNWCSNHTGRTSSPAKKRIDLNDYKRTTTNFIIAYCSECNKDKWFKDEEIIYKKAEFDCHPNGELLPERIKATNEAH